MRILAPSIVDPQLHRGGAGTVMRALAQLLSQGPSNARTVILTPTKSRRLHRVHQAASLLRSVGSRLPAKAHFVRTRGLRREVARRLREEAFDLLLIQGSDLLWLLDDLPTRPPTLLLAFNIEHEVFRSQIESFGARGLLREALLRDCEKLQSFEERALRTIDGVLCVSRDDAEAFRRIQPDLPILHVPPLFDQPRNEAEPRCAPHEGLDLGFLGNFEWWPNRAGFEWFLREVFAHIPQDVRLHVFGQESERLTCDSPRVLRHGFAPRLEDVWRRCDFMICPVNHGAGVSVKVAEILYHRVPVLARPFATRGLPLDPDPAIVILESAANWIEFLASSKARSLARARVSAATSEQFAFSRHATGVHEFVARAAASRGENESSSGVAAGRGTAKSPLLRSEES